MGKGYYILLTTDTNCQCIEMNKKYTSIVNESSIVHSKTENEFYILNSLLNKYTDWFLIKYSISLL